MLINNQIGLRNIKFLKLIIIEKRSLIIIDGLDVQLISLFIYFFLKIKKCIIIRQAFSLGFFEIYQKLYNNKFNLKEIKFNFNIKKVVIFFINTYKNFLRKFFILKSDYFIYSGHLNYLISQNERKTNTKFLSFYSYEFRKCKEKKFENIIIKDKYALFIDQGIGYHNETLGLNHNELENFYKNLNNFFNLIEKKYNLKIIFLNHPLSENQKFIKRENYNSFSKSLINKSEFVICISSGALIFPILLNKNIIFIESNILKKLINFKNYIHAIKILLKVKYFNIDNLKEFDTEFLTKLTFDERKQIIKNFGLDLSNFEKDPFEYILNEINYNSKLY